RQGADLQGRQRRGAQPGRDRAAEDLTAAVWSPDRRISRRVALVLAGSDPRRALLNLLAGPAPRSARPRARGFETGRARPRRLGPAPGPPQPSRWSFPSFCPTQARNFLPFAPPWSGAALLS